MKSLSWKVLIGTLVLTVALFVAVGGVSLAVQGGELNMSPKGQLGVSHITMYLGTDPVNGGGPVCGDCHDMLNLPVLTDPAADMKPNHACFECHPQGGKPDLFISHMRHRGFPSYYRCSDCHKIKD